MPRPAGAAEEHARVGCLGLPSLGHAPPEPSPVAESALTNRPEAGRSIKVCLHVPFFSSASSSSPPPPPPSSPLLLVSLLVLPGSHTAPDSSSCNTVPHTHQALLKCQCLKPLWGTQKRASQNGTTASEDRSTSGIEVWEEADPTSFMVRGRNYASDRKKFLASGAIYRCCLSAESLVVGLNVSWVLTGLATGVQPMATAHWPREEHGQRGHVEVLCCELRSVPMADMCHGCSQLWH